MLHNASDWFAIKRNDSKLCRSNSCWSFQNKVTNEWKRMLAMDVIYYDKFLINGANESQLSQFKAGDKVCDCVFLMEVHHLIFCLLTQEEKSRSLPMT
jgi:hypothetical protein